MSMRVTNIFLTREEAQCGCRKLLTLPGQAAPLSLVLKPGTRNNTQILIHNAQFYDKGGMIINIPVKVLIHVKGDVSTVGGRKKKNHWVLKTLALLLLIGIGVGLSQSKDKDSIGSKCNVGSLSDILPVVPSGGGQTAVSNTGGNKEDSINDFEAAAPNVQTGTDIPAVLLQKDWGPEVPEYCPKIEFFPGGKFRMWINLLDDYCSFDGAYEVYQYSDGLRVISCDISSLVLENCLWKRVYLLESSGDGWKYQGASIGVTDSFCSFVKANSDTVSVSVISVQTPGVTAGSHWATDGVQDELAINWVDAGKVNFDFDVYRIYGFENQTGFCTPDGSVYCYLSVGEDSLDGLVRLTFQEQSISLEFLTAESGRSHYLDDYYVGDTYIFR